MAVDMRSRYFGAPEEAFMFDEGAMSPSFSVLPQYEAPNNNFMVMPPAAAPYAAQPMMQQPAAAPYAEQQYLPAVQPMTQEAVAPYDLSGLDLSGLDLSGLDLSGLNFGSNFGVGAMGGQYQPDPNLQYIAAPLSNKGNPTSQTGGNTFAVRPDQPVRLVDHRTNQVVFEGSGYDAARKATELGQGLTDQFGRKANYSIQTADPAGAYNTVAYEKKNKSTLGTIANIAGTALPLALMAIPGANAALLGANFAKTLGGKLAFGALTGALGSGLKGDNILKGAAIGGLSAAGGSLLPKIPAIGDLGKLAQPLGVGVGTTVGNLATGQNLKNSLLSGVASGALAYATPGIQKGLGIGQGAAPSTGGGSADTSVSYGGPNADIIVNATPSFSAPVNIGGFKTPAQKFVGETAEPTLDEILVKARTAFTPPVNLDLSNVTRGGLDAATEPTLDEILVNARETFIPPVNLDLSNVNRGDLNTGAEPTLDEILVKARTAFTPPVNLNLPTGGDTKTAEEQAKEDEDKKKLGLAEYLRLAGLAAGLIGGGGGGGGGGGTPGSQAINPIFSAKLPTPGVGGAFKVGGLDYTTPPATDAYRYAMGPAMDIPAGMNLRGATSPYAGYGPGTLGEETFKRVTGMAQGGAMGYARGSSRDSFAVNGPGTGRSDDIPAVLSDGEYVIDAETVALLGDGSSKAGAKKLDEMRVKVRKHKGRNLAKGKFSVNAKRPEKYLSGGRT